MVDDITPSRFLNTFLIVIIVENSVSDVYVVGKVIECFKASTVNNKNAHNLYINIYIGNLKFLLILVLNIDYRNDNYKKHLLGILRIGDSTKIVGDPRLRIAVVYDSMQISKFFICHGRTSTAFCANLRPLSAASKKNCE